MSACLCLPPPTHALAHAVRKAALILLQSVPNEICLAELNDRLEEVSDEGSLQKDFCLRVCVCAVLAWRCLLGDPTTARGVSLAHWNISLWLVYEVFWAFRVDCEWGK